MISVEQTIQHNELKLAVFIVIISVIILFLGYIISEIFNLGMIGIFISFIVAAGANFISYFYSRDIVLKSQHAIPMRDEEFPEYCNMVREMCERNNIYMPDLYYIKTNALNAFATGRDQKHAAVVITEGMLRTTPLDEISGVIGHELSHIVHKDIMITSFIAILIGYVTILATAIRTASMYRSRQNNGLIMLVGLACSILVPIAGMIIKMAISRSREYMADATGGQICGDPRLLAKALYRISHDGQEMPMANTATAPLYISNPFKGKAFSNLFSTHPDINDRIRRLNEMRPC